MQVKLRAIISDIYRTGGHKNCCLYFVFSNLYSLSRLFSFFFIVVVFVCCHPDIFRQLMVNFHKANLPQEEFVFIYIDVFGRTVASQPAQPWARGDADDDLAKEAYRVSLRKDFIREIQCACV